MSAFNFPSPPVVDGTEVTNSATGVTYKYDASADSWNIVSTEIAVDINGQVSQLSADIARIDGLIVEELETRDELIEDATELNSAQEVRLNALEAANVTYQISTDKVLRAGDPAIELVDSAGYYSNVKFQGTGGIAVTSDLQSIIIDGSNIDAGVSDVNLTMVYSQDNVIIKVNGSAEDGVTINSAGNYAAGIMTSSDWKKLTAFETADSYYTKDEIDNQFSLRGVGYTYLFSSFMGGVTIRPGEVNTDNRIVGQVTQISIAPEDDNGKQRRDAVVGDTLEIFDTITAKYYRYLINQGSDGTYGVTWQGSDDDRDDFLSMGQAYLLYMYPTHISSSDYYNKTQSNERYLNKKEGTQNTLASNIKYTGEMSDPESLVNKQYIEENFLSAKVGQMQDCQRGINFMAACEYTGSVQYSNNIANKRYVDEQVATRATVQYVNDEVDKMASALSAETSEPNTYYGDYAPTGTRQDGDMWFDSMHLRLNIWSQGAWVNPDRNDGASLENRIAALEARVAQLEGN